MTPLPDQASTPAPPDARFPWPPRRCRSWNHPAVSRHLRTWATPAGGSPPDVVQTTEELMLERKRIFQPSGTYSLYAPTN